MKPYRTIKLAALAVVALLAIGGVAVADNLGSKNSEGEPLKQLGPDLVVDASSPAPPANAPSDRNAPAESIAAVTSVLGALSTSASSRDQLPSDVLKAPFARDFIDPDASRLALTTAYGASFYLVPVYPGIAPLDGVGACLLENNGAGTCQSLKGIAEGKAVVFADHLPELGPDKVQTVGIVPDGVSQVSITGESSKTRVVKVSDNAWIDVSSDAPAAIEWSGAEGKVAVQAPAGLGSAR